MGQHSATARDSLDVGEIATPGPRADARHDAIARFQSLLAEPSPDDAGAGELLDPGCASDLRLDQVVEAIVRGREEADDLRALLYRPVAVLDAIRYRQEVFSDLEDERLLEGASKFAVQMRDVRRHLSAIEKMHYPLQRQGWFLDAAAIYCQALRSLAETLDAAPVRSRALTAFRAFLGGYLASEEFTTLDADTTVRKQRLGQIVYDVGIRGSRVDVSCYDDEPDYSVEVEALFERFAQGEVRDYRRSYRGEPGFNHVTAQILELVARLFPEPFAELAAYCEQH
ncbi:MAG TPA: hypothetical protein VJU80_03025, partial [Solirubrobacteraceae bacterium]|nr:hypothetical protein [Solirubrobacteraceae bacterium]